MRFFVFFLFLITIGSSLESEASLSRTTNGNPFSSIAIQEEQRNKSPIPEELPIYKRPMCPTHQELTRNTEKNFYIATNIGMIIIESVYLTKLMGIEDSSLPSSALLLRKLILSTSILSLAILNSEIPISLIEFCLNKDLCNNERLRKILVFFKMLCVLSPNHIIAIPFYICSKKSNIQDPDTSDSIDILLVSSCAVLAFRILQFFAHYFGNYYPMKNNNNTSL
ncbi:MAG: hypothetical protein KBD31_02215 [Proteobacteria bacterium]|nr:hypothetical protein [Pseudomonadota bacterium]